MAVNASNDRADVALLIIPWVLSENASPEELNSTAGLHGCAYKWFHHPRPRQNHLLPDLGARQESQSLLHVSLVPSIESAAAPGSWRHKWLLWEIFLETSGEI